MRMTGKVTRTALAAAMAAVAGAGLLGPGTAHADSPIISTTDRYRGGWAWFRSAPNPERITVADEVRDDKYAVVAFVWARQDDGSWVRRMRARAGAQAIVEATHNIDEGRRVRLMVCLEEGDGTQVYCNTWEGTA
jgi:hypothetical protein